MEMPQDRDPYISTKEPLSVNAAHQFTKPLPCKEVPHRADRKFQKTCTSAGLTEVAVTEHVRLIPSPTRSFFGSVGWAVFF
jgi:hypothetical protein